MVHDHPGAQVDPQSLLAVGPWPDGTFRYDLGLVEFVLLLVVCAIVYGTQGRAGRHRLAPGQLTALVVVAYACLRLPLDFLRAEDLRYGPLTPAQYACVAFLVVGLLALRRVSHPFHTGSNVD